jgi:sulfotransferase family protein
MSLAWVASYPKSGNTWVRIMLSSYLQDARVQFHIAEMGILHDAVTDLIDMFDQGRMLPVNRPGTLAVKTHFLPGAQVHRPYRSDTRKVLYLVRNPRDVIHSAERFLDVSPKHRTAFAEHFLDHRGVAAWRQVGYGSWPEHVQEWTSPARLRRHFPDADVRVVRYEDLKHDTAGALHEMIDFLGFDTRIDPDRVRRAVANSSLATLRDTERRDEFRKPELKPFFGKGLSDQSLADYGARIEESYRRLLREDAAFAELTERFGYPS